MAEVGKVYRRKGGDTNQTVTVVEENEKFRTCIVQFEDGKTINITTKTLHDTRRWEAVEAAAEKVVNDAVADTSAPTVEILEIELAKPKKTTKKTVADEKKTVKTEKKSAEDKPKTVADKPKKKDGAKKSGVKKDENSVDTEKYRADVKKRLVKKGFEPLEYEKKKNVVLFKKNGKSVIRLYFAKKHLEILVKSTIVPKGVKFEKYKYFLDAVIRRDYTVDTQDFIESLLSTYTK